jgi:hypothetical protein
MAKSRVPLGIRPRVVKEPTIETAKQEESSKMVEVPKPKKPTIKAKKGRPSTKKGKKLIKYSMDIHPELKRAVVKAAAINDKEVHVMWNEIIFDWLEKERKKYPGWYDKIKVDKSEL